MADDWGTTSTGISGPARRVAAVTPSDSTDLAYVSRGIYIGVAGDVAIISAAGDTATFIGAGAGTILPICAARVLATGTTATSLVAIW